MQNQQNYNYNPVATMDNLEAAPSTTYPPEYNSGDVETMGCSHSSQQLVARDSFNRELSTITSSINPSFSAISKTDWFTVFVLCFINLINYMDRFTMAGVLPDIQDDLNIKDDDGGLLQTVFVISYMLCAPIFGYLGDRHSRRFIMATGVFIWCATTFIGSFMKTFSTFILFRAFVGIGEASYSTIAPTILSDLFVNDMRSKILAMFYFAIPVGSGLGYIVGSETATYMGDWRYALRVTPILGFIAVVLLMFVREPMRGLAEGSFHMETTNYKTDLGNLVKNRSFMLSTCGFTCVTFVAGALAWWAPKFIYLGTRIQPGNEDVTLNEISLVFGVITMLAGIIGVPMGSYLSQRLTKKYLTSDPILCAIGLFISAPLMAGAMIVVSKYKTLTFIFIFFGQLSLNINWVIVADMLLYVVVPTRRSTAEAFQILVSHMFGDAGSPYLIGVLSEFIKKNIKAIPYVVTAAVGLVGTQSVGTLMEMNQNSTEIIPESLKMSKSEMDANLIEFKGLQYALFTTCFVEVLGGIFFLLTAIYIVKDRQRTIKAIKDSKTDFERRTAS